MSTRRYFLMPTLAIGLVVLVACRRGGAGSTPNPDSTSARSAAAQAPQQPVTSPTLDGRTFAGESVEHGRTAAEKDELAFANGRMHSKGCDPYGFGDAPYTATASGDSIHFTATTTSPKEGSIAWSGTVVGETLAGTFIWTKQGQDPITYEMKGMLKK
ncbi:MAG TPA: hypothetical protein VHI13_08620 [Candidatus Kapabacteria bacterium]|nr:hypothetical protein [Candidatus Kapabacteria bacterium]